MLVVVGWFNLSHALFCFIVFGVNKVLIEQEKERYDAISCQSRELIRYNFGYGSANDSDGNSSIDLEWFEETELDSDGNPIDDDDNDDCSGDCESQFSQFGDKDEWDGFNEDDYTTVTAVTAESIQSA